MKYANLTKAEKATVRRNFRRMGGIRFVGFSQGYDLVSGPDEMLRRRASIEYAGEDAALPYWARAKMINFARQGMRNGDSLRGLVKQMELNVVGTVGGRATFAFPDRTAAAKVRGAFAAWARECEFADDLPLSEVLRLVVTTKFLGGDMVLLFDDGLVEDSGKIIAFEPDEIANIAPEWFKAKFPQGWSQHQGRIYNANGRFVGVTVSHKYRGLSQFPKDENGVIFLTKDADADVQDWTMLRDVWRFNQGRGAPSVAAPLDSLLDLESVTKYEVQSAMKNAQTLGQILQDAKKDENADDVPEELDRDLLRDAGALPDENGNLPAEGGAAPAEGGPLPDESAGDDAEDLVLDNIKGSGAIFDLMPEGLKMELLDTKRPNPNVEVFVKWLAARAGFAVGMGRVYSTGEAVASYTAFRGEQVMTWPMFEQWQKNLERGVCDWVLAKWSGWAVRHGKIDASMLPEGWQGRVAWTWPQMREVDAKATAEAKKVMLENGLLTFAEIYPGDPDEFKERLKRDLDMCAELGIVHPINRSASGGTLAGAGEPSPGTESDKENKKENGGDNAE